MKARLIDEWLMSDWWVIDEWMMSDWWTRDKQVISDLLLCVYVLSFFQVFLLHQMQIVNNHMCGNTIFVQIENKIHFKMYAQIYQLMLIWQIAFENLLQLLFCL